MKKLCALLLLLICLVGCKQTPEEPAVTPTPEQTENPQATGSPVSAEEKAALYTQLNELIDTIPTEPMDTSGFPKKVLVKQKEGTTLYLDEALTDHGERMICDDNELFFAYEIRKGVYKLRYDITAYYDYADTIYYLFYYGYTEDFEIVEDPIDFFKYHKNFQKHTYTIGDKTFEQAFLMESKLTLRDGSYIRYCQYSEDKTTNWNIKLFYYGADGNFISTLPYIGYDYLTGFSNLIGNFNYCVQTDLNRDGLPDLILMTSGYALEPREGYDNPFLSGDKVFEVNQMEQLEKLRTEEGVETYLASEARAGRSCVLLSDATDGTYSYYNSYEILPSTFKKGYVPFASEVNKVTAELFEGAEKGFLLP